MPPPTPRIGLVIGTHAYRHVATAAGTRLAFTRGGQPAIMFLCRLGQRKGTSTWLHAAHCFTTGRRCAARTITRSQSLATHLFTLVFRFIMRIRFRLRNLNRFRIITDRHITTTSTYHSEVRSRVPARRGLLGTGLFVLTGCFMCAPTNS